MDVLHSIEQFVCARRRLTGGWKQAEYRPAGGGTVVS
jgi:hypothetical protein